MKRWLVGFFVSLLALAALWWGLGRDEPVAARPEPTSAEAAPSPPAAAARPPVTPPTFVAGTVVDADGKPAQAKVALRASAPFFTSAGRDGRFAFEGVPEGPIFLSASLGEAASEVLGPLQLGPGAQLTGLTLVLGPAVRLEGVLVDLVTRAPIPKATVMSAQQVSTTDEAGRFTVVGARGGVWLDVVAPGYLSRSEWVSLELARAGGRLELVLTPASRVEGTVTEGGAPVAAATVWAEHLDGPALGARSTTVFTAKDGTFSLESAAGLSRVTGVTPRGTRLKGLVVRLAVGERRTGLALEAGEVSAVQGVVTREGAPVAAAQLSVVDALTEDVVGVATSGPDGRFSLGALANGRYLVQVRTGRFTSLAGPFEQGGDGRLWEVAIKEGGVLSGRVVPPSAGVRVRWRSGSWAGPSSETTTDEAGRFRFEGLRDEAGAVDAEGPAGAATARAKPGDEVVLTLGRGALVVRLLDDAGRPVTDGVLTCRSLETGAQRRQLVLAPDGVARVELPVGTWEVSLEVEARGRSGAARVEVGTAPQEVTLTLEPGVVVRGRVSDVATGLPIAQATVETRAPSAADPTQVRVMVTTDARGEFALPPSPRSAVIAVRHPAYKTAERLVGAGEPYLVALTPDPQATGGASPVMQFEGIGMVVDPDPSRYPSVAGVNPDSPAERAGVQRGDRITAVDGVPAATLPMDQLVNRIRGPAGSEVHLGFSRNGQTFELTIRRRVLTL